MVSQQAVRQEAMAVGVQRSRDTSTSRGRLFDNPTSLAQKTTLLAHGRAIL